MASMIAISVLRILSFFFPGYFTLNLLRYIFHLFFSEIVFVRIKYLKASTEWIIYVLSTPLARFSLGSFKLHWEQKFKTQLRISTSTFNGNKWLWFYLIFWAVISSFVVSHYCINNSIHSIFVQTIFMALDFAPFFDFLMRVPLMLAYLINFSKNSTALGFWIITWQT